MSINSTLYFFTEDVGERGKMVEGSDSFNFASVAVPGILMFLIVAAFVAAVWHGRYV